MGLNTILFLKITNTCIIDIQQIDQDLIVSSWLIYICRTQIEGQSLIESHFPHRGPISSQIEGRFIFPTSRAENVTYAQ